MTTNCINLSNHKSAAWSEAQTNAALEIGASTIVDLPFPQIPAGATLQEVETLADQYLGRVLDLQPAAVMLQGETVFCFSLANKLKQKGIATVAACSDRCVEEVVKEDGTTEKKSVFKFVQFRPYF